VTASARLLKEERAKAKETGALLSAEAAAVVNSPTRAASLVRSRSRAATTD
jgi:hypothetical protein